MQIADSATGRLRLEFVRQIKVLLLYIGQCSPRFSRGSISSICGELHRIVVKVGFGFKKITWTLGAFEAQTIC